MRADANGTSNACGMTPGLARETVHVNTFAREVNQGEEEPSGRCSGNLDWLRSERRYVVRASGAISSGR
jgi:hypothetical protein